MADKLYRSHSLEKSYDGTSGSLTIWENSPVSPFDIGDSFYPVSGGPALTVEKVNIKDNVIGELCGKTLRQWEITIEGSNKSESSTVTHVKYNFNISADEKSGTMEVVNTGNSPAITLDIGSTFNVPGIGNVKCTNVKGSDDYSSEGVHTWTVIYDGSDKDNTSSPSDTNTKYSLAILKDTDGTIQKSGSMSIVNDGNSPALSIQPGSTFNVPGLGSVTCTKISGNDDYSDTGVHRWTMTYEGVVNPTAGDDDEPVDTSGNSRYSFSVENDSSGNLTHSGSVEITSTGNSPAFAHNVGDSISLPGIGSVTCTKVSGSDSYSDSGVRKWTVTYEASDKSEAAQALNNSTKYSLSIENNSDGVTVFSGSKEISYSGNNPTVSENIGSSFTLPVIGAVTCTRIQYTNDEANSWKILIEGSRAGNSSSGDDGDDTFSLPDTETTISYELNGTTVRSVSGEFIALKRSENPITKKSITVYSDSVTPIAAPGTSYQGGIVISENIILETIKNNGVVTGSYYKHTLEVEA